MRAALGCTVAHKVGHDSGSKHAKQKVEMRGPAPIIIELEQSLYMVSCVFNYAKTDVRTSSAYSPMFCMEINVYEY